MRLGLLLDGPLGPALLGEAAAADGQGIDVVWVPRRDRTGAMRSAAVVAAALAPSCPNATVVIEVSGDDHPIETAEEIAVTDLLLGGRLAVAVAAGDEGDDGRLGETLDVLDHALAGRPFRHHGAHWRFPASTLPGTGELVCCTPAPAQLQVPVWLLGLRSSATAGHRVLPLVAGPTDDRAAVAAAWATIEANAGPRARRPLRIAVCDLPPDMAGGWDAGALLDERDTRGTDLCVLRLPAAMAERHRLNAIELLSGPIRAEVQLGGAAPELVASW